jgi:hypothetical protein
MFVTRQCQSCQFPSFGMAVPVSTRNYYVAVVRHRLTPSVEKGTNTTIANQQRQGSFAMFTLTEVFLRVHGDLQKIRRLPCRH